MIIINIFSTFTSEKNSRNTAISQRDKGLAIHNSRVGKKQLSEYYEYHQRKREEMKWQTLRN